MQALAKACERWTLGTFNVAEWDTAAEKSRVLFSRMLGTQPANVALIPSVALGAATVAQSLPPGHVVVGESEFRSNLFPWTALQAGGCQVVQVAARGGVVTTEALVDAITPKTVLVAVSEVQSRNGYRVDLSAIAARCQEVGARLFADLTQSLGVLQWDGMPVRADFIVCHGYKWLLSPKGAAWLFVAPHRVAELAPFVPSWRSVERPYEASFGGPFVPARDARRLDASIAWLPSIGAEAALTLLLSLPAAQVEQWCLALARLCRTQLQELGLRVVPEELPSHIVAIHGDKADSLSSRLAARHIRVASQANVVRLGFHAFNTEEEVQRVLEAVCEQLIP
jgi:selenocysteine lyase/cysteine desulfurase